PLADVNQDTEANQDQADPERKRRRRRNRRGRRNNDAAADVNATQDDASDTDEQDSQAFVSHETPAFKPEVLPAIATAQGQTAESAQAAAEAQLMPVETTQSDTVQDDAASTPAVVAEPVEQEPALVEEVAGNTDTVDEQVAEAIATPQEGATPPASQASQPNGAETSLDQVLQAAGMQLIETSS